MNRRDFLKGVALTGAATAIGGGMGAGVPKNGALGGRTLPDGGRLGPTITNWELRSAKHLAGKKAAMYIDDVIWVFRDLARQRPKSMFDNPLLSVLKEAHERYGLKLQLNCFYRTDMFYGMDEFSLADMTEAYKAEWQAAKGWLKLGFHAYQEFPDYPFVNSSYDDIATAFGRVRG